jgi:acyl-homoserine lactone acylase PvdQ
MVGLSYAGLPTLWTGHHDSLAWALAVRPSQFHLESVYLHPSDPRRYFDRTRWRWWRILATHPPVRQAEGGFLWALVPFSPYGLRLTWSAANERLEQMMSALLRLNSAPDSERFAQVLSESPRLAGVYVAQTGESGWLGMEETTLVRVFRPQGLHSAQTVGTLMDDSLSPFAKTLLPYLTFRFSADLPLHQAKRLRAYQNWLSAWTGDMAADSAQAQFFARWCATLTQALPSSLSLRDILPILSEPYRREWDDPRTPTRENRDTLLLATWQSLIEDLPDEPRQDWRWDALHTATFISPVLGKNSALDALLNRRVGLGGSWDSLYRTAWTGRGETPFAVTDIPLFRVVYDPADWDNSQSILATGQSGHPASPHYDDMLDMWRSIAFRKMGWSPQAIREASANTLRLNPPD